MRPTITPPVNSQSFDRRLMLLLRRKGAQSMDYLATLPGFGWERVFFSVDRLSRAGKVSLTLVRPCGYRVSVVGPVR